MSYFKSVRFRLFLMSGALQILVAAIFITAAVISSNMLLNENNARITDSVEQTIQTATEEWRVTTEGFAKIIASQSSDEMITAIRNADHDAIIELYGDVYAASNADGATFTDMEGIALARMNLPDRFGDSAITSQAIADALTGQTVSYMYPTNSNGFSVTAGAPIFDGDEQIGVLFMTRRLDKESTMTDLKLQTACEIVLYQGDTPVYSSIGNAEASAAVFSPLSEEDMAILNAGQSITREADFNGASSTWLYTPLKGRDGAVVGAMLAVNTSGGGWVMIMWAVLFLALVAVVGPMIHIYIKNLSTPLKRLAADAEDLGRGNLAVNIVQTRTDEIGAIQGTMKSLKTVIGKLIDDLTELAEKHGKRGETDARLDVSAYEGAYAEVAEKINVMLDTHISSKRETLECISGIVSGNFDANLRKFPGQESYINESVDGLRLNIRGIVQEIKAAAAHTADGDLDYAVDLSNYKGDWVGLMAELNGIISAVNAPLSEMTRVISAMERGNFNERITAEYKGTFNDVKTALNFTVETISGNINEINETLEGMASGDLTRSITREYRGQFDLIKNAINTIIGTLTRTIGEISDAAEQTRGGAEQVSTNSQSLAQGATEQAASIEQLTAAVSEVENKSRENVNNTMEATKMAEISKANAEEGNADMKQLLAAMDDIATSAAKINNIIKTIDGIAFQTNLLALNASVEAARAGEHGKGFAVVADEVRNLSTRSSNAAQESGTLIQEALASIEEGKKRANDTAGSLGKIAGNVTDVAAVIKTINDASAKQSESIEYIGTGLGSISSVVQSNTATSEESAAASEELNAQAETLKRMIAFFRTK